MKLATTPDQLHSLFVEALNAADADALAALYTEDACILPCDTRRVSGRVNIRLLLTEYCSLGLNMQASTRSSTVVGDLALLISDWHTTRSGADGSVGEASGNSVEVAQRGPDGVWRYLIDLPHGTAR